MEHQAIAHVLLAASLVHMLHGFGEVRNVREKVNRLEAYITKKPYKEIPVNIDTRAKGIGLGLGLIAVLFLIAWLVVNLIDPTVRASILISFSALVVAEIVTTVGLDAYHADIEKVTRKFKK